MDLLITIVTLLVAIYAVIPRERQLDLRLRINPFDRVLVLTGSLAILYLEFYAFCSSRGWGFPRSWPTGVTPRHAMYLVMLGVAIFLWVRIRFSHLTRGKIQQFRELVEQLYWSESFSELLTLVQEHLKELFRIHDSHFFLIRLRGRLESFSGHRLDLGELVERFQNASGQPRDTAAPKKTNQLLHRLRSLGVSVARPLASTAAKFLPDDTRAQGTARDIIRGIFLSPRFVAALVRTRPYLGLEIIREAAHCQERFEFVDVYLTELMRATQSALYGELRNNQNCDKYRYHLSGSNRLLYFFLADIRIAKDNGIYKPIGEFAIAHLHEIGRDNESDPYNLAMTDFEEVGAWRSPLFAAIRFFDIMVKEGLFQGIDWHMWLYYTPHFVEGIARNYRVVDPAADPTAEWPIRYSFLLYQVFSAMRDWVMGLEDVPRGQANAALRSTHTDLENGNIPKSSILALAQCSRHVLESDQIGDRLKQSLMDIVFGLYFDLRAEADFEGYATVLRKALSAGGLYRRCPDAKYHDALVRALEAEKSEYFIKHPQNHVEELEASLS